MKPWSSKIQSSAILLLVIPAAIAYALFRVNETTKIQLLESGLYIVALAALVLLARAGTVAAAATGALLAFCYAITPGSLHSALWLLTAMLVMTLGASFIGRRRKRQGKAEETHGRSASQVAANLGAGALISMLIPAGATVLAHTAMLAALAEATADTLASELGQLASSPPRMLLTGKQVLAGTDGAISLPGTLAGVCGAGLLSFVARWTFSLPGQAVLLGFGSGVFGLFFDSVLGQLLERRGWLNNDAVNFLSTLAAVLFVIAAGQLAGV